MEQCPIAKGQEQGEEDGNKTYLLEEEIKMEELFNWGTLGTLAGATVAVVIITQYVKPLIPNFNPRWLALILSGIILIGVTAIADGGLEDYGLAILNAVLVASTAMGAYEISFEKIDSKKKEEVSYESNIGEIL